MPSGSVMSRAWAQCSASRVVASVAGLSGAATQGSRVPGRRRERRTPPGARPATAANTAAGSARSPDQVGHRRVPGRLGRAELGRRAGVATTASSVCARCSTTSATDQPAAPERRQPRGFVEPGEDALEPILLRDEVVEDLHAPMMPVRATPVPVG